MGIFLLAAAVYLANVYEATVMRVVDGDTVRVRVTLWHDQVLTTSIRVRDIDTPELKGKCENERGMARMAKARVEQLLPAGSKVKIGKVAPDKYGGRYDADVRTSDDKSLGEILIADGLARRYGGGKRAGWCG